MSFLYGFALVLWCWWLPRLCYVWLSCLCDDVFMMCDYPSLWQRVRLEAPTLHDTSKSLSVWVRLLLIGPKDHMQKGYCMTRHSLLPMGGRGKFLSVWLRLGRAKRPHAKEVLHGALSLATHEEIGKSLRMWIRLGMVNRPHAKRGT